MSRGIRGDPVESLESEIESRKPTVVEQPLDGLDNEPNHQAGLLQKSGKKQRLNEILCVKIHSERTGQRTVLASARRTARLLWIALIVSLCAHCVVPATSSPQWLIPKGSSNGRNPIADYYASSSVEQSREILETISIGRQILPGSRPSGI